MSNSLAITGVAEIVLSVRDLPKMRAFYQEVLGFKLLSESCHEHGFEPDPAGEPTISFLTMIETDTPLGRHGHPQLFVLIDYQRHFFAKQRLKGLDPARTSLNHLAFEIPPESFELHKTRLEKLSLGPRVIEFPTMSAKSLFFSDPEANELELICHDARLRDDSAR